MIPVSAPATNPQNWQRELAEGFRHPAQLLRHLELPVGTLTCDAAHAQFPLRVPRHFADLMEKGNPQDPLLRQVLPTGRELISPPGFGPDPTGDQAAHAGFGLLKKYRGRALVVATASCAVHCRYCFRRHYPYGEASATQWQGLLEALAADDTLTEVILSGGDPLMLATPKLADLLEALTQIPTLRRLRLHSRLPVVLPSRLDDHLVTLLTNLPLPTTLVLHVNHPAELSEPLARALAPLRRGGVTLLNQSVLLRGVNDRLQTQQTLCEKLFDHGILPYYLHQLDKVSGAAHFQVPDDQAIALHEEMRARLPGYLLPRLVHEIPGRPSKSPLGWRSNFGEPSDLVK